MAFPDLPCRPEITSIVDVIDSHVRLNSAGKIARVLPMEGWDIVGEKPEGFKTTLLGQQYFAKYFVPRAEEYARALFEATLALGDLPLNVPVLKPICLEKGTLIFPSGQPIWASDSRRPFLTKIIPQEQIEMLESEIKRRRLRPLYWAGKADIIQVDGHDYLVDVINDTVDSIVNFLNPSNEIRSRHSIR